MLQACPRLHSAAVALVDKHTQCALERSSKNKFIARIILAKLILIYYAANACTYLVALVVFSFVSSMILVGNSLRVSPLDGRPVFSPASLDYCPVR